MINLLRSEWVKFRSVRSTIVTLLLAGGLVIVVALLSARTVNDDFTERCEPVAAGSPTTTTTTPVLEPGETGEIAIENWCGEGMEVVRELSLNHLTNLTVGVSIATLLFGALGVQVIGQEYRFNTIRPTFTAAPRRIPVLIAKLVIVAVACAAVSLVMVAVCALVGTTMIDNFEIDGVDQRLFWAIPLFGALWAMAGVGVGAIVRQPIAAILILLGWSLVAEGIIAAMFDWTHKWLPFNNGMQMTLRVEPGMQQTLRPILDGGIYFAVVCAALFAIGVILANRRDA
ncbi:MAG: hypothetical protein KDA95_10545 [Acidimicrobiales bacterium]|nr:hypothetical protein [Acidimicrobiales bacterium]